MKMEQVHHISAELLCLSFDGSILEDAISLRCLGLSDDSPPLSWVRRHPDVALWLGRVQREWREIRRAPEIARKSSEVAFLVRSHSK